MKLAHPRLGHHRHKERGRRSSQVKRERRPLSRFLFPGSSVILAEEAEGDHTCQSHSYPFPQKWKKPDREALLLLLEDTGSQGTPGMDSGNSEGEGPSCLMWVVTAGRWEDTE